MRVLGSLWRHPDFLKLWAGETVSLVGSQMTALAIPLTAAVVMHATSSQMGALVASQFAPYMLITLFAGVWIDTRRRRPIMMFANLGRAILLGLVPAFYLSGRLNMQILYVILFLSSTLSVLFELSYQSYLPSLVDSTDLIEGNSKLQWSASAAQVGGPSLAGILIALLSAPIVVLLDSLSFLTSVMLLKTIRTVEPIPVKVDGENSIWNGIWTGMRLVFQNPFLRSIAGEAATYNLFTLVIMSVMVLYMTRELHIGATLLGFIMGTSSVGALCGSMCADYIGKRLKVGPTIIWSMLVACTSPLLVPLAHGPRGVVIGLLILSFFVGGFALVVSNVYVISLRQAVIPLHLLGRFNAAYRFICSAATPIGAFVGGQLGDAIGLQNTLFVGALGTMTAVAWVVFSPVAKLRDFTITPTTAMNHVPTAESETAPAR